MPMRRERRARPGVDLDRQPDDEHPVADERDQARQPRAGRSCAARRIREHQAKVRRMRGPPSQMPLAGRMPGPAHRHVRAGPAGVSTPSSRSSTCDRVPARRRQGDRQLEREHRVPRRRASPRPTTASAGRAGARPVARSPAAMAPRISRAAHRLAVEGELAARRRPRSRARGRARRRSRACRARSKPNAESGVIRKPASSTRSAIRRTNASNGVSRSATVERAGRRSPRRRPPRGARGARRDRTAAAARAPVRTSSGWWSKVMTAGRASCAAALGRSSREQVRVAEVEAVEHADDDEQAAERRLERVDAVDDRHRRVGRLSGAGSSSARSGRPRAGPCPTITPAASTSRSGTPSARAARAPARRPDEPALARRRRSPSRVSATAGIASRPVSGGRSSARTPSGPAGRGRGADRVERARAVERERAARRPDERRRGRRRGRAASPRSRASARTYVPGGAARRRRSRSGGPGRGRPTRARSRRLDLDRRGGSSTASPARAIAYARRPPTWTAEYGGRLLELLAEERRRAPASTASRDRAPAPSTGVSSPSRSSVVEVGAEADRRAVGLVVARGGTRRGASRRRGTAAARRTRTGRASRRGRSGASAASRRTSATTSCEVGPGGLRDDEDAVHARARRAVGALAAQAGGRARRRRRARRSASASTRRARLGERRLDGRAGGARVAAAAERAGQDRGVDAARLRPHRDPRRRPGPASLNRIATSAVSDWARRSIRPSECDDERAGRGEVGVGERAVDDPAAVAHLEPVQHPAEEPQLGVGLRAVEAARDLRQRRAGRDQRRRRRRACAASRSGGRRSRCP